MSYAESRVEQLPSDGQAERSWWRRPWSLAARLTAWYFVSSFLLVLIATGILYVTLSQGLIQQDDQLLLGKLHAMRGILQSAQTDQNAVAQEVGEDAEGPKQTFTRVLSDTGVVKHESFGMAAELSPSIFPAPGGTDGRAGPTVTVRGAASGKKFRLLSAEVHSLSGDSPTMVVQIASDVSDDEELLAGYRRVLVSVLAVALLLSAAAGYEIARAGLRPLHRITRATGEIGTATLHTRIQPEGFPAELRTLAMTFNEMLNRLEASFTRLRRFSDDIAHELRTPINNMLVGTEVTLGKARTVEEYRGVLESHVEDYARLSRLVQSLLFLARSDDPQTRIERETVDVAHELSLIWDFFEAAASDAGVHFSIRTEPPDLTATVDRTLFQRALSNLVANAIAHTPSGGAVRLSARKQVSTLIVEVTDTGRGIAPEHLPHVFDRFYRADLTRTAGTGNVGLGLSIVRSIAALHGGAVELESALGEGTRVALAFPIVATL